jgi:uncharacterized coiled-coil protein SlyX
MNNSTRVTTIHQSSRRSYTRIMPSRSLEQLQQHVARQESELQRLRQALAERQEQLDSLRRRKQELHEQLLQVEEQIAKVAGTAAVPSVATPKPSSRPQAPTAGPTPQQPSLGEVIVTALRESGRPLTAKQLAEEALRRGFVTTSGNFGNVTKKRVHYLYKQGILKRASGQPGYVLGKPAVGAKAATGLNGIHKKRAVSTATGKAAGRAKSVSTNGTVKRSSGAPATNGRQHEQRPLREVLTELLRRSERPLGGTELARQAKAAGYRTASQDFAKVVWVGLAHMDNVKRIPGEGYILKKR